MLSRNLFGTARSKDIFNDSIGSHRRAKTSISRTSTLRTDSTTTMTTIDSSTRYTHRSNSTAATSLSSFAADDSSLGRKSSRSRKLVKRNRSRSPAATLAGENESTPESEVVNNSITRRRAQSLSALGQDESIEYSDHEDADTTIFDMRERGNVTESEMDLSMRLELARRNSQTQHERTTSHELLEYPIEEVIYEGMQNSESLLI